mmetsp:Transcript_26007/g.40693  ORF Transcript_26007/g.40693 Transcript_26007/m.40693 type:complete len:1197 (-) Transcript_26007:140-3730(-)|eukprot:CAMPEP_0184302236 /NCGR_PEP_ID=MMETSP1049-20130417/12265_1 /TAXON_ID=77928 /ORGANISM="Proteomonas sulcata, Strain CCMP704" /LENGTH=1196 /DNA_ID=CAMNT_0026613479 /DNA_START=502 /DNA_END=4092 /DNA_ORIENTATION=+
MLVSGVVVHWQVPETDFVTDLEMRWFADNFFPRLLSKGWSAGSVVAKIVFLKITDSTKLKLSQVSRGDQILLRMFLDGVERAKSSVVHHPAMGFQQEEDGLEFGIVGDTSDLIRYKRFLELCAYIITLSTNNPAERLHRDACWKDLRSCALTTLLKEKHDQFWNVADGLFKGEIQAQDASSQTYIRDTILIATLLDYLWLFEKKDPDEGMKYRIQINIKSFKTFTGHLLGDKIVEYEKKKGLAMFARCRSFLRRLAELYILPHLAPFYVKRLCSGGTGQEMLKAERQIATLVKSGWKVTIAIDRFRDGVRSEQLFLAGVDGAEKYFLKAFWDFCVKPLYLNPSCYYENPDIWLWRIVQLSTPALSRARNFPKFAKTPAEEKQKIMNDVIPRVMAEEGIKGLDKAIESLWGGERRLQCLSEGLDPLSQQAMKFALNWASSVERPDLLPSPPGLAVPEDLSQEGSIDLGPAPDAIPNKKRSPSRGTTKTSSPSSAPAGTGQLFESDNPSQLADGVTSQVTELLHSSASEGSVSTAVAPHVKGVADGALCLEEAEGSSEDLIVQSFDLPQIHSPYMLPMEAPNPDGIATDSQGVEDRATEQEGSEDIAADLMIQQQISQRIQTPQVPTDQADAQANSFYIESPGESDKNVLRHLQSRLHMLKSFDQDFASDANVVGSAASLSTTHNDGDPVSIDLKARDAGVPPSGSTIIATQYQPISGEQQAPLTHVTGLQQLCFEADCEFSSSSSRVTSQMPYEDTSIPLADYYALGDSHLSVLLCDGCQSGHLTGTRFMCNQCVGKGLCEECYDKWNHTKQGEASLHNQSHTFTAVTKGQFKVLSFRVGERVCIAERPNHELINHSAVPCQEEAKKKGPVGFVVDQDGNNVLVVTLLQTSIHSVPTRRLVKEKDGGSCSSSWVSTRPVPCDYRLPSRNPSSAGLQVELGRVNRVADGNGSLVVTFPNSEMMTTRRDMLSEGLQGIEGGDTVLSLSEKSAFKAAVLSTWTNEVEQCIGKLGTVVSVEADGSIVVKFEVGPGVKTVAQFHVSGLMKQANGFTVGDEVYVNKPLSVISRLQYNHGLWNDSFKPYIRQKGRICSIDHDGDIHVLFKDGTFICFNPEILALSKDISFFAGMLVDVCEEGDSNPTMTIKTNLTGYYLRTYQGKSGRVIEVDSDGDVHILFEDGKELAFGPEYVLPSIRFTLP